MTAHVLFDDKKALAANLREKAGLSAGYASDLAHGKRTPSLELATQIEDKLGIPASAWMRRQDVQSQASAA